MKFFDLSFNDIEIIKSDLFEFNENLIKIVLDYNKIKHVENGAFEALNNLNFLWFSSNPCISSKANNRDEVLTQIQNIERKCKK